MNTIQLIADGGSTKTDWLLFQHNRLLARKTTRGLNPMLLNTEQIETIIRIELLDNTIFKNSNIIQYFGAGCRGNGCTRMQAALKAVWPKSKYIEIDSDLKGAAQALLPQTDGIACILGTGSNSCLYINGSIVQNTPPLGYILGDEGSGAFLGRVLIGNILKKQIPEYLCQAFNTQYQLTTDQIIERVYRQPEANRFLASFAPFLHRYRAEESIHQLLVDAFYAFFTRNVDIYNHHDLPVSFVGSIAYHFCNELQEAANKCNYRIERIVQSPLDAISINLQAET